MSDGTWPVPEEIEGCLAAYERTGDPAELPVLDAPEFPDLPDGGAGNAARADPAQLARLALARWYRYLQWPGVHGLLERRAALALAARLGTVAGSGTRVGRTVGAADRLPEPLRGLATAAAPRRPLLRRRRPEASPEPVALGAARIDQLRFLMDRAYEFGDISALTTAIGLQNRWLKEKTLSPVERAALLTDHSVLARRAGESGAGGDRDWFGEAEQVATLSVKATRPDEHDPHLANRLVLRGYCAALQYTGDRDAADRGNEGGAGDGERVPGGLGMPGGAGGAAPLERAVADYGRAAELAGRAAPVSLEPARALGLALTRLYEVNSSAGTLAEALRATRDLVRATDASDRRAGEHRERLESLRVRAAGRLGTAETEAILRVEPVLGPGATLHGEPVLGGEDPADGPAGSPAGTPDGIGTAAPHGSHPAGNPAGTPDDIGTAAPHDRHPAGTGSPSAHNTRAPEGATAGVLPYETVVEAVHGGHPAADAPSAPGTADRARTGRDGHPANGGDRPGSAPPPGQGPHGPDGGTPAAPGTPAPTGRIPGDPGAAHGPEDSREDSRFEAALRTAEDPGIPGAERRRAAEALLEMVPRHDLRRPLVLVVAAEAELADRLQGGGGASAERARLAAVRAVDAAGPGHPMGFRARAVLAECTLCAAWDGAPGVRGDDALAAAREARPLLPAGDPDNGGRLNRLADILSRAATQMGDVSLLPEAVELRREAVGLTPADHPNRAFWLSNLARSLRRLADERDDPELSYEAVSFAHEAATTLPEDHPRKHELLFNLASEFISAAGISPAAAGDPDEELLAEADAVLGRGLDMLAPDHHDQPRFLSQIALVRLKRHAATGDPGMLADATWLAREAVALTPPDDTWWSARNDCLARAAAMSYRLTGERDEALRVEAVQAYSIVAADRTLPAAKRIEAGNRLARLACGGGDPERALRALEAALDEIPAMARRSLTGPVRQGATRRAAHLAAEAAALAVDVGRPERAVELLESGRAVLYGQAVAARRYWTPLRDLDPRAAADLERIESRLAESDIYTNISSFTIEVVRLSPGGERRESTREWDPRPEWAAETRRLAAERDRILERLSRHPRFAELLRPRSLAEVRRGIAGAPVVLVAAHGDRGDALLVPADPERPVVHVPLPGLTAGAVLERIGRLETAVSDATDPDKGFARRAAAQSELHEVLEWLWDELAGPVVDRLPPPAGPLPPGALPRLWWCPVGPLVRLPLQAAGHHRDPYGGGDGRPRTVIDRVVSSSTPTLAALAHAMRERTDPGPDGPDGLAHPNGPDGGDGGVRRDGGDMGGPGRSRRSAGALVVAVPEAPRMPSLPQAEAEARDVLALVPGSRVLSGEEAGLQAVEAQLGRYPIAHFACHGDSNAALGTLLGNGLHLASGEKLTAAHVHDARLDHGALAFLSACGTAEQHPTMPDEPMHLASAFQLAGFRSVIGTLWRTPDSAAVARSVYSFLTADGTRSPDLTASAVALNTALRAARDAYPAIPTRWAAYLHAGA
ncbi:CHAT domain-containing protein [Streptomyces sp. NPDC051018]|uniref:CHAT domain-containing protein n=1 Tax=Streptomyces sp. NPDC051018 TaxID=3365639 RepID=UPI0037946834